MGETKKDKPVTMNVIPFTAEDGPPFHVGLFHPYLGITYYTVVQVLGAEIAESTLR